MTDPYEQADLLGGWSAVGVPPVEAIELAERPQWHRIVELKKPPCMHCHLVTHRTGRTRPAGRVYRAVERRTGIDGSLLELCAGHAAQQRERDSGEYRQAA
jgi:hypothetical protein